jgi:hypothetical protein
MKVKGGHMKARHPWRYDDYYDLPVGEWEDHLRNSRLSDKRMFWYIHLAIPFLLMGIGFARLSWEAWLGIIGVYWVTAKIFSFFEEINENLRYTRHKVVKGMGNKDIDE